MLTLHATTVDHGGTGVLIRGASGSGKSSLALQLMALGARLVSDDRTEVRAEGGRLRASAPAAIAGLIEARGIGLLKAQGPADAWLGLVIDMDSPETDRLPPPRLETICGVALPLLRKIDAGYFPAAIVQYLDGGRHDLS